MGVDRWLPCCLLGPTLEHPRPDVSKQLSHRLFLLVPFFLNILLLLLLIVALAVFCSTVFRIGISLTEVFWIFCSEIIIKKQTRKILIFVVFASGAEDIFASQRLLGNHRGK